MAEFDVALENAIRYISSEIKSNPDINMTELIDRASKKFDLTPMQTDNLFNKYVLLK